MHLHLLLLRLSPVVGSKSGQMMRRVVVVVVWSIGIQPQARQHTSDQVAEHHVLLPHRVLLQLPQATAAVVEMGLTAAAARRPPHRLLCLCVSVVIHRWSQPAQ
jgi:hypothetical protein